MAEQQPRTLTRSPITGSDVAPVCQPCDGDGKSLEAVGFCVNCSEFLCDDCFKYHQKPTVTRHHKLVDIDNVKSDASLSDCSDSCTEICPQHRRKTIEYFCLAHDCLGCVVCIAIDHRDCKGVQYIPEVAEDTIRGEKFSSLVRQFDMVLLQTTFLADTSQGNKLKSQDTFDKTISYVKHVRKEGTEALRRLEEDIEGDAAMVKIRNMQKMDENIKSCDKLKRNAEKLKLNMKAMLNKQQYCNLFVAMKTNTTEMQSIRKSMEDISGDNYVSDYQFQPSEQLANFLQHVDSLGQLCYKRGIKTKATKVGEICVKLDSDSKTCNNVALVMITGGRLVVVDNTNKKVKLIDIQQWEVISEFQFPWFPWDTTTTEDASEIAVTQREQCEIVILRVRDDKIHEYKKIKTTGRCCGIACVKDKFVVSIEEPTRLEIIDTQGAVLQSIVKDENGEFLFRNVYSLAISQDTGYIYVPDRDKHTVTKLSLSGSVREIYEDSNLKEPRCVTIDNGGVVYVCGEQSTNIHQVTHDCEKICTILTKKHGLDSPRSLCFDMNADRLYIGQWSNRILIYKLS